MPRLAPRETKPVPFVDKTGQPIEVKSLRLVNESMYSLQVEASVTADVLEVVVQAVIPPAGEGTPPRTERKVILGD